MHSACVLDLKGTHNPSATLLTSEENNPQGNFFKTRSLIVTSSISAAFCFSCSQNKIYNMTKQLLLSIDVL